MEKDMVWGRPMIGDTAPSFTAVTTQGEIFFPRDYYGKWVVFFSCQMDFTPVCTTELMTFASMIDEFRELDTELLGLSIASLYSHIAWLRKCKELVWKEIKHVEVTFPLIADETTEVAGLYAMLHNNASETQMVRAVYIIDPDSVIRAILYYPIPIGRNVQEIIRIVSALQKVDEEKVMTPADWRPGEDVILPPPQTFTEAVQRIGTAEEDTYCLDWFLAFKQTGALIVRREKEPEINPYPSAFPLRRKRKNTGI